MVARSWWCVLAIILSVFPIISSRSIIKNLPGFGDLPFMLETGYIGVGEAEEVQIFYYFVESQRNPNTDPLLIWLVGGPGCFALSAFFYENGPLVFNYATFDGNFPELQLNPNSWTKVMWVRGGELIIWLDENMEVVDDQILPTNIENHGASLSRLNCGKSSICRLGEPMHSISEDRLKNGAVLNTDDQDYINDGDADFQCRHCGAMFWLLEKLSSSSMSSPKFSLCCMQGKVALPRSHQPPEYLKFLMEDKESLEAKKFRQNLRSYNALFAFTSIGGKLDKSVNHGAGPFLYRLHGQNFHRIGRLLPPDRDLPQYAQLYIYDKSNEINNQIHALSSNGIKSRADHAIVRKLKEMFDQHNQLTKCFRMVRDVYEVDKTAELRLRLICKRENDGRIYNLSAVEEIVGLVVGDVDSGDHRNIIIYGRDGQLQRIHELHPLYLPLQYPILFPYGEDGYRIDIIHNDIRDATSRRNQKVTIREYLAYRLQI